MSSAVPSTTVVADGLALLIEQYKNADALRALITSYLNRIQEFENAVAQVLAGYDFVNGTPVGAQLDTLGNIVGELRNLQSDADFLIAILARIQANNSQGHPDDLIRVGKAALGGVPVTLKEGVFAWSIEANFGSGAYAGLPNQRALNAIRLLNKAKSGGSRGNFRFSPPTTNAARFSDSRSGGAAYPFFNGSAYLISSQCVTP